tara:strand:- start:4318 stop:5940 length:1623 start_codon:yes stop_codon:yes gene_type:complete
MEELDLNFSQGLCVITGETGAGKSMVLYSLGLISGQRVKTSMRPPEGEKTIVSALFDIKRFPKIYELLNYLNIEYEDEIIVKRVISDDGKSRSFINDTLVSLSSLRNVSKELIEIQSQFSEQGLLDNSTHLSSLDEFGDYQEELNQLSKNWTDLKDSKNKYLDFIEKKKNLQTEKENLNYSITELKKLNPVEGEFFDLLHKKKIFKDSERIRETLNAILTNFISDEPKGIEQLLNKNLNLFSKIDDLLTEEQQKIYKSLESLSIELEEARQSISRTLESDSNKISLEEIEERIYRYRNISRKHNLSENSLFQLNNQLAVQLKKLEGYEKNVESYENHYLKCKRSFEEKAHYISNERSRNAIDLDRKVNSELPHLKLENAKFETKLIKSEFSETGFDKVVFKIRTNPNSKIDEIKNISSGGELCRIALAIKVISQKNSSSQIVFDEVDSGIGGAVSTAVGERLKRLSLKRQVLVVTHSPQVAVLGKEHYMVKKDSNLNKTRISILKLNYQERVKEIARMLSGEEITTEAELAAKKLLEIYT